VGVIMKVLSLFDGISCGRIALERANIQVDSYYASEIDDYAIKISKKNYPNIVQLGDITNWKNWNIDWGSIDLLIGGSPCQGFSFIGKQLNFNDYRSKLFFEYVDILNHIRQFNSKVMFLLENVCMLPKYVNVISNLLNVNPIMIDSAMFAVAHRRRLYWMNFKISLPKFYNPINFDDINQNENNWLDNDVIVNIQKWKSFQNPVKSAIIIGNKSKLPCLTARGYNQYHSGMVLITNGIKFRCLSNNEAELAMTLPFNYTEGIVDKQRAKCIGNGWTIDVIAYIFSQLKTQIDNNHILPNTLNTNKKLF
jgi:DNA (cytosine-5)-methyltransferase 3A